MAGGISPNKVVTVTLNDYNSDHYLTLIYQAMLNLDWHIAYFDHDGILAYTNISWASYAEEVSVRIKGNFATIKSECVGYQAFFTSYGKNKKNLERLFDEIIYVEFHLKETLEQNTQEIIDSIPEKQFLNLENPPMGGKEQLRGFFSPIIPSDKYFITPILVIINIALFFLSSVCLVLLPLILRNKQGLAYENVTEKIYLMLGFSNRQHVLNGEIWRLATSIFLHFSASHILFNMIVLVYIGSLIESKLGKWNFLLMFLLTGITASMVSVMWHSTEISAGASGAIFGLFGILLALLSTDFYERSARRALLISTGIFVAYNIIPVGHRTDHAAHFGGLISGYILGWLAYYGLTHQNVLIKKWGMALIGPAAVILFVSWGVLVSPQYQINDYNQLFEKTIAISQKLDSDFYNAKLNREEKLYLLEHEALPKVKDLKKNGFELARFSLPDELKKEAQGRSKLIALQSRYYRLLYLEFKEQNQHKYRPEIDDITDQINQIRFR